MTLERRSTDTHTAWFHVARRGSYRVTAWILLGTLAMVAAIALAGFAINQRDAATKDLLAAQQARLDAQQARIQSQLFTLHEVCVGVRNENVLITQSFKRSLRNLPRIAYYRTHARELRAQLREIRHQLRVFRPRTCE